MDMYGSYFPSKLEIQPKENWLTRARYSSTVCSGPCLTTGEASDWWFVKSAYVFRVMHPFPRYNNLTSSSQLLRTVKAREGLALLGSKASHAGAEHRDSRGEDSYPALGLGHAALKWREARLGVCAWWSSGSWLQLKANDCDLRTKSRVNCFALGLFLCNLPPQPSSVCTNPPAQPALSETWPLYTSLHAGSM